MTLIHIFQDRDGLYTMQLNAAARTRAFGAAPMTKRRLSEQVLSRLQQSGVAVEIHSDQTTERSFKRSFRQTQGKPARQTPRQMPDSFRISYIPDFGDTGAIIGNMSYPSYGTRPAGAIMQLVQFNVISRNYRGSASHTAVIPWFKPIVHGHGMFFGDLSQTRACHFQSQGFARYNTRVEAWSFWEPPFPDGVESRSYQTSTGPNYITTCGQPWVDGQPYHVRVEAYDVPGDGQWVRYAVYYWDGERWPLFVGPVLQHVSYSDWAIQDVAPHSGVFDPQANGLFIGATGYEVNPADAPDRPWHIFIHDLSVSWV